MAIWPHGSSWKSPIFSSISVLCVYTKHKNNIKKSSSLAYKSKQVHYIWRSSLENSSGRSFNDTTTTAAHKIISPVGKFLPLLQYISSFFSVFFLLLNLFSSPTQSQLRVLTQGETTDIALSRSFEPIIALYYVSWLGCGKLLFKENWPHW